VGGLLGSCATRAIVLSVIALLPIRPCRAYVLDGASRQRMAMGLMIPCTAPVILGTPRTNRNS
jgi:hypothetical protein